MTVTVEIIAVSISPMGIRLTTLRWRYPKFIHGEAKTHRKMRIADRAYELLQEVGVMDDPALSRNASSSRAIPVNRLINDVLNDPAIPSFSGANVPGMQPGDPLPTHVRDRLIRIWLDERDSAVERAREMAACGAAKQDVNRIIEPWSHINVVVSATDWQNFFSLRDHPMAQYEIQELARATKREMAGSTPKLLQPGEWHLPFVDIATDIDKLPTRPADSDMFWEAWFALGLIKLSAARCARVSYMTHEGKEPDANADIALYDRLVGSAPLHASPTEHQATPDSIQETGAWRAHHEWGNFYGWRQHRKMLIGESAVEKR